MLKDDKAEVFKTVKNPDGVGGVIINYRPISQNPLWCYTKVTKQICDSLGQHQTGAVSMATYSTDTREFVFNYNSDIAVFDFIRYKGKWFQIQECISEYAGDTKTTAEEVSFVPDSSVILTYLSN